jgi:hypothetical protein
LPIPKDLGSSVAPQIELGYCLESGGALLVDYRYLSSSGRAIADSDIEPGVLQTNLTGHWLDLDYRSAVNLKPNPFTLQWQTGLRLESLAFTTNTQRVTFWESEETTLRTSFLDLGPHFGLRPRLSLGQTGLSLFGLADFGCEIGCTTLEAKSKTVWDSPFGGPSADSQQTTFRQLQVMADFRTELGISYTGAAFPWLQLDGGFRYDASIWASRVFSDYGPFLRIGMGF